MHYEFAVIGGGIAGSTVTYELLKRNKKVILFDDEDTKATIIAGGLINPIMGRKMNIAWKESHIFEFAKNYYQEIEKTIKSNFFIEKNIFRPFTTENQKNELVDKLENDKNIKNFILKIKDGKIYNFSNDSNGGMIIKGARINTKIYIKNIKKYLIKKKSYIKKNIDENKIKLGESFFKIEDFKFEKLIFAKGYKEKLKGFFSYLPFEPAKGEIIILECKKLNFKEVYNRHVSLIHLKDNKFYLGGTYEWNTWNTLTNEWAKLELLKKFQKITNLKCKVIDQKAHIRPSTLDREPFLGEHPKHKNIFILNGFGTRGISMAPYLSNLLVNNIEKIDKIPNHYNIKRYAKYYNILNHS
ncbi:NAD(P)/FAD-dependent oxidoreductase [Borreliella bavariensis]|uniref:NAD(P)/FAD-dependent oxidoreductase n=1 Tax=Borreliella bavariensis TaxID=664662 RepID=UPI001C00214C|nr:FAD-binding oxidoreductase [Borreliella bavariensis]